MHASIRRYRGMPPNAVDEILHIRQEFETRLRNVPGFRAWGLIRTDDGMITVTLCDDRMGAEESARVAGEFVRGNIPHLVPDPPEVANGEVVMAVGDLGGKAGGGGNQP